jgi:predicted RNA binding protein YcfA (HicA-like mRNA interferase family)
VGKAVLKNWSAKKIVKFLKQKGFVEIKKKKRSTGDHCCLFNEKTKAYTEVDMGHSSFSVREMLSIIKQSGVLKQDWLDF